MVEFISYVHKTEIIFIYLSNLHKYILIITLFL